MYVGSGNVASREAWGRCGVERPDLRFGSGLVGRGDPCAGAGFQACAGVVADGGVVKALKVAGGGTWGRSRFDKLTGTARDAGAKGLVWFKKVDGEVTSPIATFPEPECIDAIAEPAELAAGDAVLVVAARCGAAATAGGAPGRPAPRPPRASSRSE